MLDIIRKRAQSWMTIAIFAVIIIVFVFFFGFGDIGSGGSGGGKGSKVAQVDWIPITHGEFQMAVENNTAIYKEVFKEEIPEPVYKGIKPTTLQQLVTQKLFELHAHNLGLLVSDAELASKIRSLPNFQRDGNFDKAYYHDIVLPEIRRRYQVDFENIVKNELLANKFNAILKDYIETSQVEAHDSYDEKKTQWVFSVVEIDSKVGDETSVERVANELQAVFGQAAVRDKILKTYGLTEKKVGPIPLSGRSQLFGQEATLEVYKAAFALNKSNQALGSPVQVGKKWFVVRLERLEQAGKDEWKKEETQFTETLRKEKGDLRQQGWLVKYSSRVKVRRYLNLEES